MSSLTDLEQAYLTAALQLTPPKAYAKDGLVAAERTVLAKLMARLHLAADELIDGMLPPIRQVEVNGETLERLECPEWALPAWERHFALSSEGSYELRNARLLTAFRRRRGIKPVDISEALRPLLGYAPEVINYMLPRFDESSTTFDNDASPWIDPEEEVYRGKIIIDPERAIAGSYTQADLVKVVEDTQASGTQHDRVFNGLYWDDPNSRFDQDLLGV